MKNIITILFLLVSMTSFGQLTKVDTTEICLPYTVELNKKIGFQQGIIVNLEDKVKIGDTIVQKTNEKFDIVDRINKELIVENKKLNRKNIIIEIVSGFLIGALTYEVITH